MTRTAFLACLIFLGCSVALPAEVKPGSTADLQDGFFLLHDVCQKESQVSLITLVKTTPPDMASYVKRMAAEAKESVATLDRLSDGDRSLRDVRNPLPPFEEATRASIRADKQHQLLFGTKGPDFARTLLLTQIEAANYIIHLSKVWSERDPNADRAATMQKMSRHWQTLQDEGYRLLYRE
jgi:hypothetical protein